MNRKPRIGLALGSGSARGWSQIGVIRALEQAGISAEIVCGTSIGALVGAAYAAGEIGRLHDWVKGLRWQAVVSMVDLRMNGGLIEGGKLVDFFRAHFRDEGIAKLPRAFGCVATELATGREIWLREGSVIEAVRASIALPGLFTPVERDGRLLVDGGLVNPVPVSLCRAMGADIVIAVDLSSRKDYTVNYDSVPSPWRVLAGRMLPLSTRYRVPSPVALMLMAMSIGAIGSARAAGARADLLVRPPVGGFSFTEVRNFDRVVEVGYREAQKAIAEGWSPQD